MQSLVATRSSVLKQTIRGFASSAARAQATPLQKPVLNKEFKIYRWVCCSTFRSSGPAFCLGKELIKMGRGRTPTSRRRSRRCNRTLST